MHILVFILACFVHAVTAQYQFLVPDGAQTDLSESWTVGSTMEISWSKGWQGVGEELESADLWITWFRSDSYSQLLLENVTFDEAGSLNWKVNVSNTVVKEDQAFVLRLKPHSDPPLYTSTQNESPSRGFRLIVGDVDDKTVSSSSSSSSTTSMPSSTLSTLASTTSVLTSAAPSTSAPAIDGSGKSTNHIGPIVGGVVGSLVFLALLGVIVVLLLRLAKRKEQEGGGEGVQELQGAGITQDKYAYKSGMSAVEIHGMERPAELDGGRRVHELGGLDGEGRGRIDNI